MASYFSIDISTYISQPSNIQKITVKPKSVNDNVLTTRRATLRISVPGYDDKIVILRQSNATQVG